MNFGKVNLIGVCGLCNSDEFGINTHTLVFLSKGTIYVFNSLVIHLESLGVESWLVTRYPDHRFSWVSSIPPRISYL